MPQFVSAYRFGAPMRRLLRFRLLAVLLGLLVACAAPPAAAQVATDAQAYSQDELDQLLAPIALYPDDLLTQILVASTYPLEAVEAARFVRTNLSLKGTALDDAVLQHNWDASVQSLTAFPQVLAMMDEKLEWTERLGDVPRRRGAGDGYRAGTAQTRGDGRQPSNDGAADGR